MHAQGYLIHRPEPLQAALDAQSLSTAPPRTGLDWVVEWYQG